MYHGAEKIEVCQSAVPYRGNVENLPSLHPFPAPDQKSRTPGWVRFKIQSGQIPE